MAWHDGHRPPKDEAAYAATAQLLFEQSRGLTQSRMVSNIQALDSIGNVAQDNRQALRQLAGSSQGVRPESPWGPWNPYSKPDNAGGATFDDMRDTYSSPEGSSSEKQWDPWNLYSTDGHEGAVFDDTYGTYGTCSSTESRDGKDQWGPWNPYSRTAGSGAASDGTFNASPSTSTAPSFSPSKGKISSTLPAGVRANNSSACKPSPAGISTAPAPHSTSEDGSSTRRSYTSSTEPLKFDDWDANSPFDVSGSAAAVAAREAQVKQAEALAWQILYSGEKSEDDYWKKIRGSGSGEKV